MVDGCDGRAPSSALDGEQVEATPANQVVGTRARLLVVDDEPNLAKLLAWMLSAFDVSIAHEGREACRRLENETFDAVLCDLHMPGMDGIDVYERAVVRDAALRGRFVFMSGGAHSDRATAFLRREKPLLVDKPFTPERVEQVVRRVLRGTAA